jgi:hypothetical protein
MALFVTESITGGAEPIGAFVPSRTQEGGAYIRAACSARGPNKRLVLTVRRAELRSTPRPAGEAAAVMPGKHDE